MGKGKATKEHILAKAFELASENGLQSLTIGALAKHCAMSKSGLFAHFNSKDNLQISVLEYANRTFITRVITPARTANFDKVENKIHALLDNWLSWNHSFQGSCMFLDAWREVDSEQEPTQLALKQTITHWIDYLAIQIGKGKESGEFRADLDVNQASFELYGLYLSAHLFYSVKGKQASCEHFWCGVKRLISDWQTN
ncbi:TetR/AcrR family transcriptional regulator [Vibrio sonorensis]|uniref:TetR/AcrR family transcriptional regulator n=1 Tax=Vibrio sonorensis TaxID=1004316 RepID=UPI0008D8DA7B|nr:TetR/AcrR family transcriptional regulator [Vibrio sonorensis]